MSPFHRLLLYFLLIEMYSSLIDSTNTAKEVSVSFKSSTDRTRSFYSCMLLVSIQTDRLFSRKCPNRHEINDGSVRMKYSMSALTKFEGLIKLCSKLHLYLRGCPQKLAFPIELHLQQKICNPIFTIAYEGLCWSRVLRMSL